MAVVPYSDCPPVLRDFLFYLLTIRGRSARTVQAYYFDLRTFLRYIKTAKSNIPLSEDFGAIPIDDITVALLEQITISDVYAFLDFVMRERDNDAKARARKVSSIRSFFKYLTVNTTILKDNPVKDLEMPAAKKSVPRFLSLDESLELMTHIETKFPARDYCIITLFLNCGMRLSELVGINIDDVRDNTLRLLGKGNKERLIYLNDACLYAIAEYLKERKPTAKASAAKALFLSARGTRLTARRVEQIVSECLRDAGLSGKGYSPHKLRHTAATLMYQHGNVDIRVLKEILGHANLATTEIYTHVANTQMETAANRSPLAHVKIVKKSTNDAKIKNTQSEMADSDDNDTDENA